MPQQSTVQILDQYYISLDKACDVNKLPPTSVNPTDDGGVGCCTGRIIVE
jgi:hypothetical protein